MRRVLHKLIMIPLDVKIFILSSLMIIGRLFFPNNPKNVNLLTTYIVFVFINIAISSFFMTWVADSKYNFFRNASSKIDVFKTIFMYVLIVILMSYVLTITEWFMFLF